MDYSNSRIYPVLRRATFIKLKQQSYATTTFQRKTVMKNFKNKIESDPERIYTLLKSGAAVVSSQSANEIFVDSSSGADVNTFEELNIEGSRMVILNAMNQYESDLNSKFYEKK